MQITQIKRMWWGNAEQTCVGLIADTSDEGVDLQIGTPYGPASIIWEAVQAYPVEQIEAAGEPLPVLEETQPFLADNQPQSS